MAIRIFLRFYHFSFLDFSYTCHTAFLYFQPYIIFIISYKLLLLLLLLLTLWLLLIFL